MKERKVTFNITVGYDTRSIELSEETWQSIQNGEEFSELVDDWYEGEEFVYTFNFNCSDKGSLYVTYQRADDEDGFSCGDGFIGTIQDGWVDEDDHFIAEPTDDEKQYDQSVKSYLKSKNLKIFEDELSDSSENESE
jgi:hypothetical protein